MDGAVLTRREASQPHVPEPTRHRRTEQAPPRVPRALGTDTQSPRPVRVEPWRGLAAPGRQGAATADPGAGKARRRRPAGGPLLAAQALPRSHTPRSPCLPPRPAFPQPPVENPGSSGLSSGPRLACTTRYACRRRGRRTGQCSG